MRHWFTSDLHFGHPLVAELRGFPDTLTHDASIVQWWETNVKPVDVVWILGDIATEEWEYALSLISQLPGTKYLVSGNHDATHPMHRSAPVQLQSELVRRTFAAVSQAFTMRIMRRRVVLSHFPYTGDHGPDRHVEWRMRDKGLPILHGHTHGTEVETYTMHFTPQFHVGWDAHKAFVRRDEVERWVAK